MIVRKAVRPLFYLFVVIFITWLLKPNFFSIYKVSGFSMYPEFTSGQYILVSNYSYNLQSPEYYPLTNIEFPFYLKTNIRKVKKNEVVVFLSPLSGLDYRTNNAMNIKRCTGVPGDTLILKNESLIIYENIVDEKTSNKVVIKIPQRGDEIDLNESTKKYWESIIKKDGNDLKIDSSGNVKVNGILLEKYTVEQNYYYFEGDQKNISNDSRVWGLIPQSNLVGRAEFIVW